ncbi:hypothetical protein J5N97_019637 [Dioscorea zingiberensis]|uniref:Pentatricopeptide repeat-containing protein n=1 Tax=Dioscorea zingiberensis TaxID=325984 RepID=A0A9D5CFE8_9LILI|nr:hypothetical protein J5N97_019637 [Dioscorea zingiberensis]
MSTTCSMKCLRETHQLRPLRLMHGSGEVVCYFKHLQELGASPDEFAVSSALSVSANLHALDDGRQIHAFVVKKNVAMDVAARNSLINMYVKCGSVDDAEMVFDEMPERDVYTWTVMVNGYALNGRLSQAMDCFDRMPWRNTVSWNSVISACQREGCDEMAMEMFNKMRRQGEVPNNLTFVAVLKACSCLQILEKGEGIHGCMVKSWWTKDVLAGCTLMDMYAKCGVHVSDVQKALEDIKEQSIVSWSILLASYAQNGKIMEAEGIFHGMLERNVVSWNVMLAGYVQNDNSAAHIALAETFAAARMWENVAEVRTVFKEKKLLKEPGCSWIEIRNQKHTFLSCGNAHLQNNSIQTTLSNLYCNMKDKGYVQHPELAFGMVS